MTALPDGLKDNFEAISRSYNHTLAQTLVWWQRVSGLHAAFVGCGDFHTHTLKGRRTNLSSPRLGGNDTFRTADSHNWDYLCKPLSANLSDDIEG